MSFGCGVILKVLKIIVKNWCKSLKKNDESLSLKMFENLFKRFSKSFKIVGEFVLKFDLKRYKRKD
jgi:hypothetical protein